MIHKGQKIHGPDGQGYEATRDITVGQVMALDDFVPFGGAPQPGNGVKQPEWFMAAALKLLRGDKAAT